MNIRKKKLTILSVIILLLNAAASQSLTVDLLFGLDPVIGIKFTF